MKRFFAILLALSLALTLGIPALATPAVAPVAEPAPAPETETDSEAELTAVTERVVELLDVADDYTDFTGSYDGGPAASWDLYWSKQGEDLSVRGTAGGLITSVSKWTSSDSSDRFYGYDAAFPKLGEEASRTQAESWLSRLMGEGESFRIDDFSTPLTSGGEYTFSGRVLKNGLESPITFSIRIGESGLESYSRSDSYRAYVGELPPAAAAVTADKAAAPLKDAAAFELYYVTDGDEARLRYVPVGPTMTVDAQTGEPTDMDALYASFNGVYGPEEPMAEAAMEMAAGDGMAKNARALTEVELSSISNYADALSESAIDETVRSFGDLGLDGFKLDRCSYGMDAEGEITASLRYSCEMTEDNLFGYSREDYWEQIGWGSTPMVFKYISVNAKTGALVSVSTSYSLWSRTDDSRPDQGIAQNFLTLAAPAMAAESALCTLKGYDDGDTFTFARTHDGYFFPENYLTVGLNPATNTVDTFYYRWDDDAAFAASKPIVSEDAARDAYVGALTVTLGYVAWPEAVDYDDPILYAYAAWGYSYVESLRLAYYYGGTDAVSGVDALTGEPVRQAPDGGYLYDDLDGVPEKDMIEALAACGVGLPGSSFEPEKALTMRDAARLLLSSGGYRTDDWDDEDLASEAIWMGFVAAGEWQPDKTLTQEDFIVMILSASRYGDAASLDGIGFELVARALGMLDGPMPKTPCTRAGAAALLYAFMKR